MHLHFLHSADAHARQVENEQVSGSRTLQQDRRMLKTYEPKAAEHSPHMRPQWEVGFLSICFNCVIYKVCRDKEAIYQGKPGTENRGKTKINNIKKS